MISRSGWFLLLSWGCVEQAPIDSALPLASGDDGTTEADADTDADADADADADPTSAPVPLINELVSDPRSGDDFIELYNPHPVSVALAGWALTDDPSGDTAPFVLDAATLAPGGFALIWCDDGEGTAAGWHAPFKLSKDGETVQLLGPDGTRVEAVALPALGADQAFARVPDGGAFAVIDTPSPGAANPAP